MRLAAKDIVPFVQIRISITFIRLLEMKDTKIFFLKKLIGDFAFAPSLSQSINETIQSAKYRLGIMVCLIDMHIESQLLLFELEPCSNLRYLHILESEARNKNYVQ